MKSIHVHNTNNNVDFQRFSERLFDIFDPQYRLPIPEKKVITDENFEDVFDYWNNIFGTAVKNGFKTSRYFVCDIQVGKSEYIPSESKVVFDFGRGSTRTKKILTRDYDYFWSIYDKVRNPDTIRNIFSKIDRLTDEPTRRFTGEFFTPPLFARKALHHIEEVIGKKWWEHGYKLWDMAAGTGNLEWYLPADAYEHIYLSTIHPDDVDFCKRLFPKANCFQYDYLNDDVENVFAQHVPLFGSRWKLPVSLRKDLDDPKVKWIIFINPPFATSQKAGTSGGSKKAVSNTEVRKVMHDQDLGEVSRELFAQFIYRISTEIRSNNVFLGLFSTLKYVNANNDQKFRDNVFSYQFQNGFIFSSANFSGTKKQNPFPVCFMVWDLTRNRRLETQCIEVDVLDDYGDKLLRKRVNCENRDSFLSKWIDRPNATIVFPPLGGAITVKKANKDIRDRVAPGFLASLMCKGNDMQNQNFTALLSSPYASAGALSIVPANFEKSLVIHAVRRIPTKSWINDRDQFMQPNSKLSDLFISDCVVWSLFSNSNQTATLRNVSYADSSYDIINHFYPFLISDISGWSFTDSDIKETISIDYNNRFVATWLHHHQLSEEAKSVLLAAKHVYKAFYSDLNQLPTSKYKIEWWDTGWWQIRKCLTEMNLHKNLLLDLAAKHNDLRENIIPQINRYGFIAC